MYRSFLKTECYLLNVYLRVNVTFIFILQIPWIIQFLARRKIGWKTREKYTSVDNSGTFINSSTLKINLLPYKYFVCLLFVRWGWFTIITNVITFNITIIFTIFLRFLFVVAKTLSVLRRYFLCPVFDSERSDHPSTRKKTFNPESLLLYST